MSFSSEIKEELSKMNNLNNREAVKSEFIGYILTSNVLLTKGKIKYSTENKYNINRFSKLLKNLNVNHKINIQGNVFSIEFRNNLNFDELDIKNNSVILNIDKINIKNENVAKAIVRGTFLGSGSVNNPNSKYHLEVLFNNKDNGEFIKQILDMYSIKTKQMTRKNGYSLYLKDGEEISKFLAFIGSNNSVLKYEEIRVVKETRNNVNRLVNCETANLNKTINAALEQIDAINLIKKKGKFNKLDESLKEIAELRLKNPELSLIELGKILNEPVGKSGVNYRLKKIVQIANDLEK